MPEISLKALRQSKKQAAQRWTNHVSAQESIGARWRPLLVTESDIRVVKDAWRALKQLASA